MSIETVPNAARAKYGIWSISSQTTANGDAGAASSTARWQQHLVDALLLVIEILQLIGQSVCVIVAAIVRLFSPAAERSVAGEVVLCTGTGHGIGREIALQYGLLGATVVCVDIDGQTNALTVKQIESEGGRAFGFVCDVTDRSAVFALIERAQAAAGSPISILVNNAGIMPCRPLLQQTESEIRRTYDVNVYAHYWLLQATLPAMVAAGHGHVVAISSIAGMAGLPNLVPYCGSKFAVKGMMEALSQELRQQGGGAAAIKFSTIMPYMVDTGLCQKPFVRFGRLLPLLRPATVAAAVISAQRRGVVSQSVPPALLYMETVTRLMPPRCGELLTDFVGTGVEAVY